MYKFLTKNGQLLAFGLGLLLSVVFYLYVSMNIEPFNAIADEKARPGSEEGSIFWWGLTPAMALCVIAVILMLGFGLIQMFSNIKSSMNAIIGVAIIVIIFGITYSMADPAADGPIMDVVNQFEISEGVSKYISASISTTGILALLAVVAFVGSEIRNFFK